MRTRRPPLPWRMKIVAGLLVLGGIGPVATFASRPHDGAVQFAAVFCGVLCACGIGILLRNSSASRNLAATLLWIVTLMFGLAVVFAVFSFLARLVSDRAEPRMKFTVLAILVVVEFFLVWMLRILIDPRLDRLFDRRKWAVLDRSDVFD